MKSKATVKVGEADITAFATLTGSTLTISLDAVNGGKMYGEMTVVVKSNLGAAEFNTTIKAIGIREGSDPSLVLEYKFEPLEFVDLYPVVKESKITDGDIMLVLINGIAVVVEVKKKTDNHTPEKIIASDQWATIKTIAKESTYLIYATHDCEISDEMIHTGGLTVRYIEQYGKAVDFVEGVTLFKYLNKLASVGKYCIKVQYPTGNSEVALVSPDEDEKWTSTQLIANRCLFDSEEDCKEYIKKRYEKEFNQKYIYSIYYVESMTSTPLVHRYTYAETIGL